MKRKLCIIAGIALVVLGYVYRHEVKTVLGGIPVFKRARQALRSDFPRGTGSVSELVKRTVIATSPLRGEVTGQSSVLTASGVIRETNRERTQSKLPALKENSVLDTIAREKAEDMFRRQYFEHVSPSGQDIGDLAKDRYAYIVIGENLALGNYADDADVVRAWMNSPGHRANILNTRFREIGVAVKSGIFEGHRTWIAVQEFGLPESACPAIDENIRSSIAAYRHTLTGLQAEAERQKVVLESMHPRTRAEYGEYNQMVDEYNALVRQINDLIAKTKSLVAQYNDEVHVYNACATSE